MFNKIRNNAKSAWMHLGDLQAVAIFLIVVGVLAFSIKIEWLGGATFGAGLAVLISVISSQKALKEQYTKEANLKRKVDYYEPLYSELKSVCEQLQQREKESLPFPYQISHVSIAENTFMLPVGRSDVILFNYWYIFRNDHRIDNFKSTTQSLFDRLEKAIEHYNQTMKDFASALEPLLQINIQTETSIIFKSVEYKEYQALKSSPNSVFPKNMEESNRFGFYDRIKIMLDTDSNLGYYWLKYPNIVGWLASRNVDDAAHAVNKGEQQSPSPHPWVKKILTQTLNDINTSNLTKESIGNIEHSFRSVIKLMTEAKIVIKKGLQQIQDKYEGGEPLV